MSDESNKMNMWTQEYLGKWYENNTTSEIRTCRHCGLGKQYHLADLKCPFEASTFEAMSQEEMFDTIKGVMKAWHKTRP